MSSKAVWTVLSRRLADTTQLVNCKRNNTSVDVGALEAYLLTYLPAPQISVKNSNAFVSSSLYFNFLLLFSCCL